MKRYTYLFNLVVLIYLAGCGSNSGESSDSEHTKKSATVSKQDIIDSLYYFDRNKIETSILQEQSPNLSQEDAYRIQHSLKKKYIDGGESIIGYKMGGTVADSEQGFQPIYGISLTKDLYQANESISLANFPGNDVMVEAEIGFIIGKDIKTPPTDIKDLMNYIEAVTASVEFAKSISKPMESNPDGHTTNHIIAGGVGHAGMITGDRLEDFSDFDFENEKAKCYVNDSLAAEGVSSAIYGSPLNALLWLAKELPMKEKYLKKGDRVVTGSIYTNPVVDKSANIRIEFSTLGVIEFTITE